ncbi:PQQ-binding-like beta-propeller repeat protein [Streptomyces sp. NPDC053499]|uniref:outer membrane protein assembly factor BamB family protein n=1 Tax=Streptomyces sp. NPDC053499 TaxID=3365707 RepID=UPI0037D05CA0
MEPLRQDDPRRLGPYALVGRLDPAGAEIRPAGRRFLGLTPGGDRTALVSTVPAQYADDSVYQHRFRTEALAAQRLTAGHPWLLPVTEVGGSEAAPVWCASPYRPALPLPTVVETHGPLPPRTVLAIGTALGEALAQLHAGGTAHAGVTADAVLLTADGPRLTGYGTARVTAPDGEPRTPHPFLAPEQTTGGRPRPLGDLYALAAVLHYALTGRPQGSAPAEATGSLPVQLTELLDACLAADPSDRPSAEEFVRRLPHRVTDASGADGPAGATGATGATGQTGPAGPPLTAPGLGPGPDPGPGPGATVLDGGAVPSGGAGPNGGTVLDSGTGRAAGLLIPGWLPRRVSAALAVQAAAVLAAETEEDLTPALGTTPAPAATPTPAPVPTQLDGGASLDGVKATPADRAAAPRSRSGRASALSRRSLLTAVGSGAAGVAVGGSVAWTATTEEPPTLSTAERLASKRKSDKRLKGAPPTPKWRYDFSEPAKKFLPLLWQDKVALLADGTAATGIDIRTGEELWRRAKTSPSGQAWPFGNGLVLLAGSDDLLALDPRDGEVKWRSKRYRKSGRRPYVRVLAAHGNVIWLVVGDSHSSATPDDRTVAAYDLAKDRELWSAPLPTDYEESHLLPDALVVVTAKKGEPKRFTAFNRRTGDKTWARTYKSVRAGQFTTVAAPATLVAADKGRLHGYELGESDGKEQWKVKAADTNDQAADFFGVPTSHKGAVYVADSAYGAYRIDARTGKVTWRSEAEFDLEQADRDSTPDTAVTPFGKVLVSAGDVEVDAYETRNGTLLWRFTDLPGGKSGSVLQRRRVVLSDQYALVVSGRSAYALPLD